MSSGGSILTKVGDPIRLNLQLFDGDPDKFPQAILRDVNGTELVGSPVDLSHTGDGLYKDASVNMPDVIFVTASFKVYNDVGFTKLSNLHGDALDVFQRDETQAAIDKLLAESRKADFTSTVSDEDSFTSTVSDEDEIKSQVSDEDEISAQVSDDDGLESNVSDSDDITMKVEDCDD